MWPIFVILLVYHICTFVPAYSTSWLLPIMFITRLLLIAPLFACGIGSDKTGSTSSAVDGRGMQDILKLNASQAVGIMFGRLGLISSLWNFNFSGFALSVQIARQALFEHPAVSSLGCDFIISVLSFGIWKVTSRTRQATNAAGETKIECAV